jgi:hypothetical protein
MRVPGLMLAMTINLSDNGRTGFVGIQPWFMAEDNNPLLLSSGLWHPRTWPWPLRRRRSFLIIGFSYYRGIRVEVGILVCHCCNIQIISIEGLRAEVKRS